VQVAGSACHEYQDARTYAKWGVDYLKEDWCNTSSQDAKSSYTIMRDALYAAGRPIVFSLVNGVQINHGNGLALSVIYGVRQAI